MCDFAHQWFRYGALRSVLLVLLATPLLSCRSYNKNPELEDKIYLTYNSKVSANKNQIKSIEAQILSLEQEIMRLEPQNSSRSELTKRLSKLKTQKRIVEQRVKYFEIKSLKRAISDRKIYDQLYSQKQEHTWPLKNEIIEFENILELQAINKNWSSRVPAASSKKKHSTQH